MGDLKRRSERVEREAWKELYFRAPGELRQRLGLRAEERGGVTFLSAARLDHLLFNRAIGLGSSGGVDERAADRAVSYYAALGVARYWVHLASSLRGTALAEQLSARGVVPYPRSWMKFARRAAPLSTVETDLVIRAARRSDAARIAEIAAPAFDLPDEAGSVFASAIGAPGWHYYVAENRGRVVAASSLFVRGHDGLLVFAATSPEARRKGAQRALMVARLEHSQRLGCDYAFTETGLPVKGEPSGSSYRNMLRVGFDELYVRDNFAPEGTRWQKQSSSDEIERSSVSAKPSTAPPKVAEASGT